MCHPEREAGLCGHRDILKAIGGIQRETKVHGEEIQLKGAWGASHSVLLWLRPPAGL